MIASDPETVHEKLLEKQFTNPDGWGIGWKENNHLCWQSGLSYISDFTDTVDPDNNIIVGHVRLATTGEINKINTHPFPVKDQDGLFGLLFHNGTFYYRNKEFPRKGIKGSSDTADIARLLSSLLYDHPWKRVRALYEELCGETIILLTKNSVWAYRGRYPLTETNNGVATSGGKKLNRGWYKIKD